jgi:predicted O-methyltransferase YrrM
MNYTEEVIRPENLVPVIAIENLIENETTITLSELIAIDGNVSILELVVISSLVRKFNPALSFEIGTFDGRTTLNIALNQKQDTEIVTLDLPSTEVESCGALLDIKDLKYILKLSSGSRFASVKDSAKIVQLYGDSSTYDFSKYVNKVDLMFIDGSHSYNFTLNDSYIALSLVRKGGIIIWHDYGTPYWYGATRALNELFRQQPEFANMKHIAGTSLCVATVS